jgi:YgiT-type zinc finger domain-containing protein
MSKTVMDFCIFCGKNTEHIRYVEDRTFDWMGTNVEYTEMGRVCSVCGNETQSVEENNDSMNQIRENYRNR